MSQIAYNTYVKIGSDVIQISLDGVNYVTLDRIAYITRVEISKTDPNLIDFYRTHGNWIPKAGSLTVAASRIYDITGAPLGATPAQVLNAIAVILETSSGELNGAATAANQVTQISQQAAQLIQETATAAALATLNTSWDRYTQLFYTSEGTGPAVDAFESLRVSRRQSLLDLNHRYSKQPLLEDEITANGGSSTHLPNESTVRMDVTAVAGSRVVRQTKEYFKYQAAKSQLLFWSVVMCEDQSDVGIRTRSGYFDDAADKSIGVIDGNGVYFERSETGELAFCLRSYITGSQVNTRIVQADWNYDRFDGTGPSGITIDVSLAQIVVADMAWLGVGTIRYGFSIDGKVLYAHYLHNANMINSVYMTTASLPIRYEITNITGVQTGWMKQICGSVNSEAGFNPRGLIFGASMDVTPKSITSATALPLISLRLGAAYNRATINPLELSVLTATSGNILFTIVVNGSLTGPSFAPTNPYMFAEVDTAATAISGGIIIKSIYVSGNIDSSVSAFENVLKVVSNIAGTSDILTIAAQKIGAGQEDVLASIQWQEYV